MLLDDIRHDESIAAHNFTVLQQSLEDQLVQINKDLENAKADVTVFTTTPLLGSCSAGFLSGLVESPGKPRVPHCEERLRAAHSRKDQMCIGGWP